MLTSVLLSLLLTGQVPSLLPDPSPSASVPVSSSDAPVRPTSFLFQDPPSVPAPVPEPAPKRPEVPSDGSPVTVPVEIEPARGPAPKQSVCPCCECPVCDCSAVAKMTAPDPVARPPAAVARTAFAPVPVKQWVAATNRPGWEGYCRLENGAMLDIEQWRYVGPTVSQAIPIPTPAPILAPPPVVTWTSTQNVLGGGGSVCGPGGCSGQAIGFPMFRRFGR
jgi:hypothetical protein